jgi:hypothetical protein
MRTDLFSFGCVLYEMATGRPAFAGNTLAVVFDALLNRAPIPPSVLNPTLPPGLESIIQKALEKDRVRRYPTAAVLGTDLEALETRERTRVPSRRVGWRVAAAVFGIALVAYFLPSARQVPRVSGYVRITNDGRPKSAPVVTDRVRLYYTATVGDQSQVYDVSLKGGEPLLTPTPFGSVMLSDISRSGSELLVQSGEGMQWKGSLWIFPPHAGRSHRLRGISSADFALIGDAEFSGAALSPDGRSVVYSKDRALNLAMTDGAGSRELAKLPGVACWLRWSPGGRAIRFTLVDPKANTSSLWEVAANGSGLHPLLPGWKNRPSPTGHWERGTTKWWGRGKSSLDLVAALPRCATPRLCGL